MPREIYPNAPIALVACEIRIPSTGQPLEPSQTRALEEALGDAFPLAMPVNRQTVQIGNVAGPATNERVERFADRERRAVVSVTPASLVVETSQYRGYEAFRPLLDLAIRAVTDSVAPKGPMRIGLRYIDEIRLMDNPTSLHDWEDYLSEAITGVSALGEAAGGLEPKGWQGQAAFSGEDGMTVVVRYGPRDGLAVKPDGLPQRHVEPGPFFLFDIDSFWEPSGGIPEWDVDWLLGQCDQLHAPIRALFEGVITDKLRDEVLRVEPEGGTQ